MKKTTKIKLLGVAVAAGVLAGCASQPFQRSETVTPTGQTNIVYSISPAVSNALATAGQINTGYVPAPFNGLVETGLGLVAIVLAGIARYKTQQAAKQRAAADLLASHVVKSGQSQTVLQTALSTPAAQAVAEHIDNNTAY